MKIDYDKISKTINIYKSKKGVNYCIRLLPKRFWWQIWKPAFHEGRGYYVTIGLWLIAIYRGY